VKQRLGHHFVRAIEKSSRSIVKRVAISIIGQSPEYPAIWSETTRYLSRSRCLITNLTKDKQVHQVRERPGRRSVAQMQCGPASLLNAARDQFHPND
jgi:hypothetical protein